MSYDILKIFSVQDILGLVLEHVSIKDIFGKYMMICKHLSMIIIKDATLICKYKQILTLMPFFDILNDNRELSTNYEKIKHIYIIKKFNKITEPTKLSLNSYKKILETTDLDIGRCNIRTHYNCLKLNDRCILSISKFNEKIMYVFELKNLTYISIKNTPIVSVPKEISNLINLETIIFQSNEMIHVSEISKLHKVKYIEISNNQIEDINWICSLLELEKIILCYNKIITIPKKINHLTRLTYLDLTSNKIENIPNIAGLKYLETFYLDHNQIESLEWLNSLSSLKTIILSSNKIIHVPEICNSRNLTYIHMAYNKIEEIDDSIKYLTNLTSLDFSSNKIKNFPLGLVELSSLDKLYLRYNKIESIPKQITRLTNLRILDLRNNFKKPYVNDNCQVLI
jgi:Leucine-rich repeat (LRR) protein